MNKFPIETTIKKNKVKIIPFKSAKILVKLGMPVFFTVQRDLSLK